MSYPVERPQMELTSVDGIDLQLYDRGAGEPVVFVHGGSTDECTAVLQEPDLAGRFRVIHYQRRGWGGSSHDGLPLTIEEQAADCRAVMDHLGIERAHLAGLSYGATILLQFAVDHPDAVHTLALAEPSLPVDTAEPEVGPAVEAAVQRYAAGDKEGAVRTAFSAICGPGFDATFDRILPAGWLERWAADADTLIQHDIPALGSWAFTPEDAATIEAPVLNLVGADSAFKAVQPILQSWIPHAEPVTLPDTAHCIFEVAPRAAAEHLASFFSRHPLEG